MTPLTPEGAALIAHREAAAAELDLLISDPLVHQYAALRMAHDLVQVRIAEGDLSAIPDLVRLHDAMMQIKSLVPQKPIETTLTIVRGVMDICPQCGFTAETTKPKRESVKPPPTIDAEVVSDSPPTNAAAGDLGNGGATCPVQPLALPAPERRDPGSIHNAVLPDGTPARMAPSATRQVTPYVGGYAPFGAAVLSDPNPFSVHASYGHPLPTPGGDR